MAYRFTLKRMCFLFVFAFQLMLGMSAFAIGGLDIIRTRLNDPNFDISNDKRPVPTHSTNVETLLKSLDKFNADGSYVTSIPDISEEEKHDAGNKWDVHKAYLKDVANIAVLYGYNNYYSGSIAPVHDGKAEYKELIYKTLSWYFTNHRPPISVYHETFNYQNYSGTTTALLEYIGMLLYDDFHTDRLNDESVQTLFNNIVSYCHHVIVDNPQTRGPNWSFRFGNCLRHVMFSNDTSEMNTYMAVNDASIDFDVWAENGTDGVWPDWSLTHHGDMNYWGMYGTSWFGRTLDLASLVKDTEWEYSERAVQFIESSAVEGLQWILFHGNTEFTTSPKRLTYYLDRTENIAPAVILELKKLVQLHGDKLANRDKLVSIYNNIDPSWQSSNTVYKEVTGHKYFWNTEYQVHRRDNYSIAVRRCSQRVRGPEDSSNSDIRCHLHFGSGYTSIQWRGDEHRLSRLGLDYQTPAGTTTELNGVVNAGKSGSTKRGVNLFSGGVEEGGFGAGAFEMKLGEYKNNTWNLINGAGALKGNFFFENEMVCLGQDVKRIKNGINEIWTTINQVQRRGTVVYSLDNKSAVSIGLDNVEKLDLKLESEAWFWHDNVAYVINTKTPSKLKLLAERRTLHPVLMKDKSYVNALSSEDKAAGTINMFQLAINHGVNPSNDTYSYRVIPDISLEELKQSVNKPTTTVLQNSNKIQAVYSADDRVLEAVFYEPGEFAFGLNKTIKVDKKTIIQIRQSKDGFVVSAANPIHRGLMPSFIESAEKTVGELYETPVHITLGGFGLVNDVDGRSTVAIQLPTERGYEGKTVSEMLKLTSSGGFGEIIRPQLSGIQINGEALACFRSDVFFYEFASYEHENKPLEVLGISDKANTLSYSMQGDTTIIRVKGTGGEVAYRVHILRKDILLSEYTETFSKLVNDGGLMSKGFVGDNDIAWNLRLAKYSKHQGSGAGVYIRSGSVESEYIGTGISSLSISLMNKYVPDGDSTTLSVYLNDSLRYTNVDKSQNEVYMVHFDNINLAGPFKLRLESDSVLNKALVIDNISWKPYGWVTSLYQTKELRSKIVPNPFCDHFFVSSNDAIRQMDLYNMSGRLVYSSPINKQKYIRFSEDVKSGVYILRLSGNGYSENCKVVKI